MNDPLGNGVNLAGMELGYGTYDPDVGPILGTRYPNWAAENLDWYSENNVQSVRIPICWEALQKEAFGALSSGDPADSNFRIYWDSLVKLVNELIARDIEVILAPWQYNQDAGTTDIVYKGEAFTKEQFADFWGKFSKAINAAVSDPGAVSFDLINEPHETNAFIPGDVGIARETWFDYAQAAIDAIRDPNIGGAENTILVSGMNYGSARLFVENGSAAEFLTLNDPSDNLAVTAHLYIHELVDPIVDETSDSALVNSVRQLLEWARANGVKVNIGEVAIDAGANGLGEFNEQSNFAKAEVQWQQFTELCRDYSDVVLGWNWWANGAAGWWDQGDSAASDHWALSVDGGATETVYMDLIEASLAAGGEVGFPALLDANPELARGISAVYDVLLGGVPSQAGFRYLIDTANDSGIGAFNEENIFINVANALVAGNADAREMFVYNFSLGTLSVQDQLTAIYEYLVPDDQETDAGLAFFSRAEAQAFYQGVAAERGVAGPDAPAIIALAALLKMLTASDTGVGEDVNDFIEGIGDGTFVLPQTSIDFTPI